jgi:hypothetical protein
LFDLARIFFLLLQDALSLARLPRRVTSILGGLMEDRLGDRLLYVGGNLSFVFSRVFG